MSLAIALEKVGEAAIDAVEKTAEVATKNSGELKEIYEVGLSEVQSVTILKPNMEVIKSFSLESIIQGNLEKGFINPNLINPEKALKKPLETAKQYPRIYETAQEGVKGSEIAEGLTDAEKALIKSETGWSDVIIEHIKSMEQYAVYKNADLHEAEINGRKCLLKDIDLDYIDEKTGMTNRELMEMGRSPIDAKTGEKIELHHMGQDFDSPFAELTENSEHGDGNHAILHNMKEGSWRNEEGFKNMYLTEKKNHWKTRSQGEV